MRDLTLLDDAATVLLGCVCEHLQQAHEQHPTHPGCPCITCVTPGKPAWDSCCDCLPDGQHGGQLTVHVEQVWPYQEWPDPATGRDMHKCAPAGMGLAADLVVTLLRCTPTVSDQGFPPGCDQLQESARVTHVDQMVVAAAVTCCFPEALPARRGKRRRVLLRESRVVGPEGGCVGSETRVTVDLGPACLCLPETSS